MSDRVVDVTLKVHFPPDMDWATIVAELNEAEWSFLTASQTKVEVHDYEMEYESGDERLGVYERVK